MIADEPTTGLDVTVQAGILKLLKGLQQERGLSIIMVSHDLGVIAQMCDRVVVMKDGRVVEQGRTLELLRHPRDAYTQKLIQSVPRLRSEEAPDFIPGAPPDLTNVPLGCRFHPRCPYAFEPCGWSSGELAAILAGEAPAARPGGVASGAEAGSVEAAPLGVTGRKRQRRASGL